MTQATKKKKAHKAKAKLFTGFPTGTDATGYVPTAQDIEGKPTISTPRDFGPGAWAVSVAGDCMEPNIPNGSMLVCSPVAEFVDGGVYVVELLNGERFCKRVYDAKFSYICRADNPSFPPFAISRATVKHLTRCVWCAPFAEGEVCEDAGFDLVAPELKDKVRPIDMGIPHLRELSTKHDIPRVAAG